MLPSVRSKQTALDSFKMSAFFCEGNSINALILKGLGILLYYGLSKVCLVGFSGDILKGQVKAAVGRRWFPGKCHQGWDFPAE